MNRLFLLADVDTGGPGSGLPAKVAPVTPTLDGSFQNPVFGKGLQGLSGLEFFQKLIPALVGLGFLIGTIVFFFVMLLGAIQWIISGGDKAAVEGARGKIMNAIIGLVVLFSLLAFVKLLENFFGIDILTLDIGPLKIE